MHTTQDKLDNAGRRVKDEGGAGEVKVLTLPCCVSVLQWIVEVWAAYICWAHTISERLQQEVRRHSLRLRGFLRPDERGAHLWSRRDTWRYPPSPRSCARSGGRAAWQVSQTSGYTACTRDWCPLLQTGDRHVHIRAGLARKTTEFQIILHGNRTSEVQKSIEIINVKP